MSAPRSCEVCELPLEDGADERALYHAGCRKEASRRLYRKRARAVAARRGKRVRSRTIAAKRLTPEEIEVGKALFLPDVDRPANRGECKDMPRPCPFVSCKHHLFLDVNPETGSIKLNFPDLDVWEMAESCSLDVADRGGITLEEVGEILNLTRERIRQVEVRGLLKLKMGEPNGSLNPLE